MEKKFRKQFFAFLVLAILLVPMIGQVDNVHAVSSKDSIRFVGSATSNVTDIDYAIRVNYTSSSGNFIIVSVQNYPNCPASSVTDTGGSVYGLLVDNTLGGGGSYLQIWSTTGSGSKASTSIRITIRNQGAYCNAYPWNTFDSVIVAEYSGVADTLGVTAENESATIGSGTASCFNKDVDRKSWLVTGFAISRYATITPHIGDLRNTSLSGFQQGDLFDSKGTPPPNKHHYTLRLSEPDAGLLWYCAGVELRMP